MTNEWGNDADRSFSAAWLAGDVSVPVAAYAGAAARPTSRALLNNSARKDYRQHYGFAWAFRRETWGRHRRLA